MTFKKIISSLLLICLFSNGACADAMATTQNDRNSTNGRLLTCLVFSMETISLLTELQRAAKDETKSGDVKASIDLVGGREKIALALLDAELILQAFAKKISERHIIKMDEKLFENPTWQLANQLYSDTVKDTSFNQRFSRTVDFTQSCMDNFLH